jgi:hypothetical protein
MFNQKSIRIQSKYTLNIGLKIKIKTTTKNWKLKVKSQQKTSFEMTWRLKIEFKSNMWTTTLKTYQCNLQRKNQNHEEGNI